MEHHGGWDHGVPKSKKILTSPPSRTRGLFPGNPTRGHRFLFSQPPFSNSILKFIFSGQLFSAPNQKIPSSLFLSRGILPPRSQFRNFQFPAPVSETFAVVHERSLALFLNKHDLWLAESPQLGPYTLQLSGVRIRSAIACALSIVARFATPARYASTFPSATSLRKNASARSLFASARTSGRSSLFVIECHVSFRFRIRFILPDRNECQRTPSCV